MLVNKITLFETSDGTPALAAYNNMLFVAWKGSDNQNLNVELSNDGGQTFGLKYTSDETSDSPPALVAHNGILFAAWRGLANNSINVARVGLSDTGIAGFANKNTLPDTTQATPSLASFNSVLFLSWQGMGSNLNIEYSTDNGATFGNKFVSSETTGGPPVLITYNGALYVAWRGSDNTLLNIAQINLKVSSNNTILGIQGLANKVTLTETSESAPGCGSTDQSLYFAWSGSGNQDLNTLVSQGGSSSFTNKSVSGETSDCGPTLAGLNGRCFVSWRSPQNNLINIACVIPDN